MVIHSYCSYTYSSIGYQYGTFDISNGSPKGYLSEDNKLSLVSAAFDCGMIRELFGLYEGQYIYLVKKLKYTSPNEIDVGKELYINAAFSFPSIEKEIFYAFQKKISVLSDNEKATIIGRLFVIDPNAPLGLHMDVDAITAFFSDMSQANTSNDSLTIDKNNGLSIVCITSKRDYSEEIANALNIDSTMLSHDESDLKLYHFHKKKDLQQKVFNGDSKRTLYALIPSFGILTHYPLVPVFLASTVFSFILILNKLIKGKTTLRKH